MEKDTGVPLQALRADGGASRDSFLMQFQADILGTDVVRPVIRETTALGAAYLAGLAVGYWEDHEDLLQNVGDAKTFAPAGDAAQVKFNLTGWHDAVARARTSQ